MADALFTINGDSSNQGYDAEADDVLTLQLKTLPVAGVQTVRFQVWSASSFDPDLDPISNPPRKSKDAPDLVLDNGAETGASLSPLTVDGEVFVVMPATEGHAWLVRCIVNGGLSQLADGRIVIDRTLIHQRMIVVRDPAGNRPIIATETTEYEDDGWAAALNATVSGATGPTGAVGPTGPAGNPATNFITSVFGRTGVVVAVAGDYGSSKITNQSSVPGASVTDALNALAPPTSTAPGFRSRIVYVHSTSAKIGVAFAGVLCQAATVWTLASHVPDGEFIEFQCRGPGGGSGSGAAQTQASGGGSLSGGAPGGGGANPPPQRYSRDYVISQLPITFDTPLGGTAGAAVTHNSTQGTTLGNPGGAPTGGASIVGVNGTIMFAGAGASGTGGTTATPTAGAGGGCWTSGAAAVGGRPFDGVVVGGTAAFFTFGGANVQSRTKAGSGAGTAAVYGGGGGAIGNVGNLTGTGVSDGGRSQFGGGGGGQAGGGGTSGFNPVAPGAGSDGGGHDVYTISGASPTGGGGGAAGAAPGNSGAPGAEGDERVNGCGGGGGYGISTNVAAGQIAGSGGAGGFPGGGAGGGAACLTTVNQTTQSGAGAKGGDSCIIVTAY